MRRSKTRRPQSLPMGKRIILEAPQDYAVYYDGQLLGYRATRLEALELADAHVYEQLRRASGAA